MGLFGSKDKKRIQFLESELRTSKKRIRQLDRLCEEKDSYFMESISDGLRHGSSLAAKHMSDRKKHLNGQ